MVLSIGIFFTLMIVGLSGGLHQSIYDGLRAHGVSSLATKAADLPPVSTLFAAFLGYNPVQTLLGHGIKSSHSPSATCCWAHVLPLDHLPPFASALSSAFIFGMAACILAGLASMIPSRGVPFIVRLRPAGVGPAQGVAEFEPPETPPADLDYPRRCSSTSAHIAEPRAGGRITSPARGARRWSFRITRPASV